MSFCVVLFSDCIFQSYFYLILQYYCIFLLCLKENVSLKLTQPEIHVKKKLTKQSDKMQA